MSGTNRGLMNIQDTIQVYIIPTNTHTHTSMLYRSHNTHTIPSTKTKAEGDGAPRILTTTILTERVT